MSRRFLSLLRWLRGYGLFATVLVLWLLSSLGAFWSEGLLAWSAGLLYIAYDSWLIAYVAWNTRQLRASPPPAVAAVDGPRLGVLVAARNEAAVLPATLANLLPQLSPRDRVLVVDDGSDDGSLAVLRARHELRLESAALWRSVREPRLTVLSKPHSGKADSLNRGLAGLDCDVVVTLDADTRLEPGALAALRTAFFEDSSLAAACGLLRPRCAPGPTAGLFELFQHFEYLRAFLSRAAWMQVDALLLVSGAFAAYRREVLEAIGGFDRHSLVEDYELIHRLHRHAREQGLDWRVRVVPGARADTDAPANLRSFLRQRRRWFAGFLGTQYRYRALHGDPRYGAVGRLMLPVKAVDTLQPVYGLTAFGLLLWFATSGAAVTFAVLVVIALKLVMDLAYHLWALHLYHRWLGLRAPPSLWARALFATLAEPFSFQLLRHLGAAWGWVSVITGRLDWAPQRQPGAGT